MKITALRTVEKKFALLSAPQHHPNAAVKTWLSALESCSKREDRFVLLSYLYQGKNLYGEAYKCHQLSLLSFATAHMDWGKFRDALDYGHHQLGISEELDNPQMRSEAYLNLARAHERLGKVTLLVFQAFWLSVHSY